MSAHRIHLGKGKEHSEYVPIVPTATYANHGGMTVVMQWDADRYAQQVGGLRGFPTSEKESLLMWKYPPLRGAEDVHRREQRQEHLPLVPEPCIVVDQHGRVLLWSLPGILSKRLQVCIIRCI